MGYFDQTLNTIHVCGEEQTAQLFQCSLLKEQCLLQQSPTVEDDCLP